MAQFIAITVCDTHYFHTSKELETWVKWANARGWKQGEDYLLFQRIIKLDDSVEDIKIKL